MLKRISGKEAGRVVTAEEDEKRMKELMRAWGRADYDDPDDFPAARPQTPRDAGRPAGFDFARR